MLSAVINISVSTALCSASPRLYLSVPDYFRTSPKIPGLHSDYLSYGYSHLRNTECACTCVRHGLLRATSREVWKHSVKESPLPLLALPAKPSPPEEVIVDPAQET